MDEPQKSFHYRLIGWILVLAAVVSSFMNGWLVSLDRGVWFDEALSAFFIEQSWPGLFTLIGEFEANMAFYYVSLKLWASGFSSEIGLRLFSFLAYLGMAAIIAMGIKRVYSAKVSLIFLVLFFGHFYLIRYGVEVRGYALAGLGLAGLWYCWLLAVVEERQRWWIAYAALGVLAVHTHFFVSLGVLGLGLTSLFLRQPTFVFRHWLLAHSVIALSFVPITLFVIFQEKGQLAWLDTPGIRALLDTAFMYAGAAPPAPDWVRRSLLLICTIFSGWALISAIRSHSGESKEEYRRVLLVITSLLSLSLSPVVLVFFLSQFEPAFSSRFFVPFVPFYLVLVALGVVKLGRLGPLVASGVVLVFMTVSTISYANRDYFSWADQSKSMLEQCLGQEGILFMTPNAQSLFEFYKTRLKENEQCSWTFYPYKIAPYNYVRGLNDYPNKLVNIVDLDAFWIVKTHVGQNEGRVYRRYLDQVSVIFEQCRVVTQTKKVVLLHCR